MDTESRPDGAAPEFLDRWRWVIVATLALSVLLNTLSVLLDDGDQPWRIIPLVGLSIALGIVLGPDTMRARRN